MAHHLKFRVGSVVELTGPDDDEKELVTLEQDESVPEFEGDSVHEGMWIGRAHVATDPSDDLLREFHEEVITRVVKF